MRSWMAAIRKLRGLFGTTDEALAQFPGQDALVSGEQAALATEALLSDAVWRATVGTGTSYRFDSEGSLDVGPNAFGGRLSHRVVAGGADAVAGAAGLAMTGARAAVFLSGERLLEAHAQLRAAAERRIPMVLHVTCDPGHGSASGPGNGHESVHAIADTGAVVLFARNAQDSVDLTLLARMVAESALVPVIVAMDGPETAWGVADVRLCGAEAARALVGAPGDDIESPTPAQRLLFGESRRRVPRWFDPDRPAALGVSLGGDDLAASLTAQAVFFSEHVPALLRSAQDRLVKATGRSLTLADPDGPAEAILVAEGAVVEEARAVADRLRAAGQRVGVLGIRAVRPFPTADVRSVLGRARIVTVLERVDGALGAGGPLWEDVRSALLGTDTTVLAATYGLGGRPPHPGQLAALFRNMTDAAEPKPLVHLDLDVAGAVSRFPKRQALQQGVRKAYPDLGRTALASVPVEGLVDESLRSVALYATSGDVREGALFELAQALVAASGPHVRSYSTTLEQGVWAGRVAASKKPLVSAAFGASADIALVSGLDLPAVVDPTIELPTGGALVVATELRGQGLWWAVRPAWRAAIRARTLRLVAVSGGMDALVAMARVLLLDAAADVDEVAWRGLTDPPELRTEAPLPLAVRRFQRSDGAWDSVPRFFGEVVQPRLYGEAAGSTPDPFLALRAMPPSTATFRDRTSARTLVPVLEPETCTGCGACWTACPDSATCATALPTEDALNAAAARAAAKRAAVDPIAAKLERAHKQLAPRIDSLLAKAEARVLSRTMLDEAYAWLADKMKVTGDDRVAMNSAFDATAEELLRVPMIAPRALFHDLHAAEKGAGSLLALAFDPVACQGCGICAAECKDTALRMEPQTAPVVDSLRQTFGAWEELPDTPGRVITKAAAHADLGPLPAILLSRACQFALSGGDGAEPGSGERLATRLVAAVAELEMQRRLIEVVQRAGDLSAKLRDRVRSTMAASLPADHLDALDRALSSSGAAGAGAAAVFARLEELGERTTLDRKAAKRLVRAARDLEQLRFQLAEGRHGFGRARFGVVATDGTVREWAASFPFNPFGVPVTMDLAGNGVEVARGIAEGLLLQRTDEVRVLRLAQLALDGPSDIVARERALEALTWHDLTDEERLLTPPLLLLVGAEGLSERALTGLSALLASDLPVKVLLLDGRDLLASTPDATLIGIAHRRAFVASGSPSHLGALYDGATGALSTPGPALLHLIAPSPRRHGFSADATVARARAAVASRVHPIVIYDPRSEGVFGRRIRLDANPSPLSNWADLLGNPLTPGHFAVGEARYAEHFAGGANGGGVPVADWAQRPARERTGTPVVQASGAVRALDAALAAATAERLERWQTLQELAGLASPFIDVVRERVVAEIEAAHAVELANLKADYEQRLSALESGQAAAQAERLRERLLNLAGYAGASGAKR